MDEGEIAVGMQVRYPRTGTTGKVERLERIGSTTFASIDSTHLSYRIDMLVSTEAQETRGSREGEDFRQTIEKEREFFRTHEAWKNTDQSCEGGG
jgi:hypothetical protein